MSNSSSSDDIVNICHLFENTHLSESQNTSTNPSHSISSITFNEEQILNVESDTENHNIQSDLPLQNRFQAFLENSASSSVDLEKPCREVTSPLPNTINTENSTLQSSPSPSSRDLLFAGLGISPLEEELNNSWTTPEGLEITERVDDSGWHLVQNTSTRAKSSRGRGTSRGRGVTRGRGTQVANRFRGRGARPKFQRPKFTPCGQPKGFSKVNVVAPKEKSARIHPQDPKVSERLQQIFDDTLPFKDWPSQLNTLNLRNRGSFRARGRGNLNSRKARFNPRNRPCSRPNISEFEATQHNLELGVLWDSDIRFGRRTQNNWGILGEERSIILGDLESDYSLDPKLIEKRLDHLLPAAFKRREILNRRRAENIILLQETEGNPEYLSAVRQQRITEYHNSVGALPLWKLILQEFERNHQETPEDPSLRLIGIERDILASRHLEVLREENRIKKIEAKAGFREAQCFTKRCYQIGIANALDEFAANPPETFRALTPPILKKYSNTTGTQTQNWGVHDDWVACRGASRNSNSSSSNSSTSSDSSTATLQDLLDFCESINLPVGCYPPRKQCDPEHPCRNRFCQHTVCTFVADRSYIAEVEREERVEHPLPCPNNICLHPVCVAHDIARLVGIVPLPQRLPVAQNILPELNLREDHIRQENPGIFNPDPEQPPPYSECHPETHPRAGPSHDGPRVASPGQQSHNPQPQPNFRPEPEGSNYPHCGRCGVRHRDSRPPTPVNDQPAPQCANEWTVEFYDQRKNILFRSRRPEGVFFMWGPGDE